MAKFFLVVENSCLKKRVLKPKCAVTNVDWNNLTFEGRTKFARDELKCDLMGQNQSLVAFFSYGAEYTSF